MSRAAYPEPVPTTADEQAPAAPSRGDRAGSVVLLLLPLLAAYPALMTMAVAWFVSQGRDGWWDMRSWSELLVWQLPLALWIATLIAVIVLVARRRRAFRAAAIGVAAIGASMVIGLALPLLLPA